MDKSVYPFETVELLNRLNMAILVDYCSVVVDGELVIIVRANEQYHRTTVGKNIEQIAFQLCKELCSSTPGYRCTIVEFSDRPNRRGKENTGEEWWQWRFRWVGNTPLDSKKSKLSPAKINLFSSILLNGSMLKSAV